MPTSPSLLVFIPNLLRPPVSAPPHPSSTLSTATPSTLPQINPSAPRASRSFTVSQTSRRPSTTITAPSTTRPHNYPRRSSPSPTAVLSRDRQTNADISTSTTPSTSEPSVPLLPLSEVEPQPITTSLNLDNSSSFKSTSNPNDNSRRTNRQGRKHSEESRRKIGIANRGNTPWNKGRRHSEETRRKIAEATRKAMMRPEMRQLLRERAKSRRHSEATKLKIRQTSRLTRSTKASMERKRARKNPMPYEYTPDVIKSLNDEIEGKIGITFLREESSDKLAVRERRVVAPETRQKLSQRIKELWNDPEYRARVSSGIEERASRLGHNTTPKSAKKEKAKQKNDDIMSTSEDQPEETNSRNDATDTTSMKSTLSNENSNTISKPATSIKSEEEVEVAKSFRNSADMGLDLHSLDGWTKEDLGIFGEHDEGIVANTTYECPDEKFDHLGNNIFDDDGNDEMTPKPRDGFENEELVPVNGMIQNGFEDTEGQNLVLPEFLKDKDNTQFNYVTGTTSGAVEHDQDTFMQDHDMWETNDLDLSKMGFANNTEEFNYANSGDFVTNEFSNDSPFSSSAQTMGE